MNITSKSVQSRRELRALRNAISATDRELAESRIADNLRKMSLYRRARHIGIYLASDGECSLQKLIRRAGNCKKQFYAPVVSDERIRFAQLHSNSTLSQNRFGILEPAEGKTIDSRSLDLVLTPLVAFDDHGGRLGMGGGFFDREFRFLRHRSTWFRPKLIGIGFELQHVRRIEIESWDVRLWSAVTESRCYQFF